MTENLEQRTEEPIQAFAGPPGVPGGTTPIYMEEFPAETNNDTTKYDGKNAIWDSGTAGNGYKNISFANNTSGLQFRVSERKTGDVGSPLSPGHLQVRTKVMGTTYYSSWEKIYHTGNLNVSQFLTTADINAKADKTYVDSVVASKASTSYVDSAVANKADKSALNAKADKTYVDEKIASVSGGSSNIVCVGYANNSALSCSNGISGTCASWGGGSYQVHLNTSISGGTSVSITPEASDSANLCVSVSNVVGSSFSVNITKNGAGFNCPFHFQVFKY